MIRHIHEWLAAGLIAGVCFLLSAAETRGGNFGGYMARAGINQFNNSYSHGLFTHPYGYGPRTFYQGPTFAPNYGPNFVPNYGYPAFGYYNGWYGNQGYPAYGYGNGFYPGNSYGGAGFGVW